MLISEKDVRFKAVRSGKPGGQRANRRDTKIQARVCIQDLLLSEEQKRLIREKLHNRINRDDELIIESEEERFQDLNKENALERLNTVIEEAITVPPERVPTEPPRSADDARIRHKHMRYQKKKTRRISRNAPEDF